jgi:hypothetical protein
VGTEIGKQVGQGKNDSAAKPRQQDRQTEHERPGAKGIDEALIPVSFHFLPVPPAPALDRDDKLRGRIPGRTLE